ncbi:MAG TPA: DUF4340 domain-containing protein [Luteolibacter sp.]|nr:DUF4340 domain-containing protein [Luteolibacter sp.]
MRSTGFTLLLAFGAAIALTLAVWQLRQGGFEALLGAPPHQVGSRVYDSFTPAEVKHIRIRSGGATAVFSLGENGWLASAPWEDRMDPRAAVAIIQFALGMCVEDVADEDEVDDSKSGLGDNAVRIRLEGDGREILADFRLGRVTPWRAEIEGFDEPVSTVFVQPRDRGRGRHAYIATGDITALFRDGLKLLRDHGPFYFNPANLEKIRIRSQQGDLTLSRAAHGAPWRITKPLELSTDPAAMKKLLEGMFELRATRVTDRAAAVLPATDGANQPTQIGIVSFGDSAETVLEIFPPENADARVTGAMVSDRPGTWFELPLKPEAGVVSLADLPLAMNDLRDPVLTRLNIASLRRIEIVPSTGEPILIERQPPSPWMTAIDGKGSEANESNLFELLKAVTSHRATAFESDAATDFSPWGLDRPILTLRFLGEENQGIELRFGLNSQGDLFVNRAGTPTVMRVDRSILTAIAVRPHEWRHARLWSLSRVDLTGIVSRIGNDPPLVLKYDFIHESWQATSEGRNLDDRLVPARANHMLAALEGLQVSRWLARDDAEAAAALLNPSLVFQVVEKKIDGDGNFAGLSQRTLRFAPGTGQTAGFYYGSLDGEAHPFLIDTPTYNRLALDLLEE